MLSVIVLLYSFVNVGDMAVADALYKSLLKENTKIIRINLDANQDTTLLTEEYKREIAKLASNEAAILAIGEKGLVSLKNLKQEKLLDKDIFVSALIHQYFNEIKILSPRLDFLSIPESASIGKKKPIIEAIPNYIYTLGVPTNNPTIEVLQKKYNDWNIELKPSLDTPYIIVMLPGDAPDAHNKMKYFTKDSAKALFNDVFNLWKEKGKKHHVIVENGPRTGKFNPITGEIACNHEYNKDSDASVAIDDVSKEFIALLKQNSIPYYFYNFAFEINGSSKKAISVMDPITYIATTHPENYFIIPGESVSLISQIPLYLEPKQAILFKPSSMNLQHKKIFHEYYSRGHISYFSSKGNIINPKQPVKLLKDDSDTIAIALLKAYAKKVK